VQVGELFFPCGKSRAKEGVRWGVLGFGNCGDEESQVRGRR